jgi:hypothetical protein
VKAALSGSAKSVPRVNIGRLPRMAAFVLGEAVGDLLESG